MAPGSRTLTAVALLIVAPVGAVVAISALLLFGATPHTVFLPGFFVRAKLAALGIHAPNAVGVVTTLIVWWAIVVLVWLAVRRIAKTSLIDDAAVTSASSPIVPFQRVGL